MCGYTCVHVYFEVFVFCFRARIGLLIETGRETEKLIIVPLTAIDRNGFRRMKEEGRSTKHCLIFFNFCLGT